MSVKWGVLGTANIARGCTIPGMQLANNCELYAIAGRNEAKVESYRSEFGFKKGYVGYNKLLSDPDVQAVYIPLPNNSFVAHSSAETNRNICRFGFEHTAEYTPANSI